MSGIQPVINQPFQGLVGRPLGRPCPSAIYAVMLEADKAIPGPDNLAFVTLMEAIAETRDRSAFTRLFDHFAPRVNAYMRRRGAAPAAAEELVQDVMLTVWRRAGQFDPAKAAVSTWIFTIARNRRIDTIRRERRPAPDPSDPALVPNPDPGADAAVEQQQHGALLRLAVAKLPEEQAQLLELAYFEDKSHSAIAGELSLPLGTVKSRIRLAMNQLRTQLAELE